MLVGILAYASATKVQCGGGDLSESFRKSREALSSFNSTQPRGFLALRGEAGVQGDEWSGTEMSARLTDI